MKANYLVHDKLYAEAKSLGWSGWGGDARIAKERVWLDRLFSFDGVPQKGKVLELGCGEGHFSRLLAEKKYEVVAIDISSTAIEWAKEKIAGSNLDVLFLQGDLTKIDVLGVKTFDIIADGNCLHCIIGEDRQVFLTNIYNALNENGVFFISTLLSPLDEVTINYFEGKPYRYISSLDRLKNELEDVGFEIVLCKVHEDASNNHCTMHLMKRFA